SRNWMAWGGPVDHLGLLGATATARRLDATAAGRSVGRVAGRHVDFHGDGASGAPKNELKPWLKEQWCIPPQADAEFACAMEDVLAVYHRPYDEKLPLVCLDETSKQRIGETRQPLPAEPGQPERFDYEYERKGTAN